MTPGWVRAILEAPGVALAARVLLTSAFWSSGVLKLFDFEGAMAEAAHFGLQPPALVAAATIAVQLIGSALVIANRWVWLGGGALAVFTLLATLIAHAWWTFPPDAQPRQLATFLKHMGLIGGFVLAAILAARREAA